MKKTVRMFSAVALVMAILISNSTSAQKPMKMAAPKAPAVMSASALKTNMRKLWEDHIVWTRNVILCITDDLPGTDQAVKRLLQNQVDIGNAIKPYYGEEAGKKLTDLLTPHITIAAEVVKAAKTNNSAALADADKRWHANADQISEFLSIANPHWALADMKMMMNDHLKLTTDEAVQRIKENYDADVMAYDKVHNEILKMSDMLSDGIVKQFPDKFKAGGMPKTASK